MLPPLHGKGQNGAPLEGELLPSPDEQLAGLLRRLTRPFDILWLVSLPVTAWLVWLSLRGGPTGVMDILLVVLLCLPFALLSAARLGLWWMSRRLIEAQLALQRPPGAPFDMRAMLERMRQQAAESCDWCVAPGRMAGKGAGFMARLALKMSSLMLSPKFFFALGLALLAILVMIPVALFTLLLKLF